MKKLPSLYDNDTKKLISSNPNEYLAIIEKDIIFIANKLRWTLRKKHWRKMMMICWLQQTTALINSGKLEGAKYWLDTIEECTDFSTEKTPNTNFYMGFLINSFTYYIKVEKYNEAKIIMQKMESAFKFIQGNVNLKIFNLSINKNKCILEFFDGNYLKCIDMIKDISLYGESNDFMDDLYVYLGKCYRNTMPNEEACKEIKHIINKCVNEKYQKELQDLLV